MQTRHTASIEKLDVKVVIVGAEGLAAAEFARQLSVTHRVAALTHADLDVTINADVVRTIADERPSLIINCAVAGVDVCEADHVLAHEVNVVGAENLARAANNVGAEIVYLSSNYVFDGKLRAGSFYTVTDPPCPLNVYGHSKLAGERAVTAANHRAFIIRTSWVFGPGKKSFLNTLPDLLRVRKTVRAISDIYASATYVHDLVKRVLEIVATGHHATYHVVNSGLCSFAEFAFEVARLLDLSMTEAGQLIELVPFRDFAFAARRPHYSPMSCVISEELGFAPLRDWQAALAEYTQHVRQHKFEPGGDEHQQTNARALKTLSVESTREL